MLADYPGAVEIGHLGQPSDMRMSRLGSMNAPLRATATFACSTPPPPRPDVSRTTPRTPARRLERSNRPNPSRPVDSPPTTVTPGSYLGVTWGTTFG
jgi:hypothetical protein